MQNLDTLTTNNNQELSFITKSKDAVTLRNLNSSEEHKPKQKKATWGKK